MITTTGAAVVWCRKYAYALPLINAYDKTKAIADNKIVILFLVLSIFVIANPTAYVLKNTFSNCYPHLTQIESRSLISNNEKMEYLHIHSCLSKRSFGWVYLIY